MLFKGADLGEGIRKGLFVCSYSVIPSLFPFMVLSVFVCKSSAAGFFASVFRPLTSFFKIPSSCGSVLFASAIGGYPTGAKCIDDLVSEGVLDRKTASFMLCYCVNAGPAFLISTIGITVFGSAKIGFLIFAAHLLSSAVIAFFVSRFLHKPLEKEVFPAPVQKSNSSCLVESVISAAESCFNMCAFIVLFSGVLELLQSGNFFHSTTGSSLNKAFLYGFLEVVSGVLTSGEIKGLAGIVIAGAISSFSGVSVILQVAAAVNKSKIPLLPFIFSRFFHAGITAGILWLFLCFSGDTAAVFSVRGTAAEAVLSASAPAAVSLLCMASLFLLSLVPKKSEKEPLFSRIKSKLTVFRHSKIE